MTDLLSWQRIAWDSWTTGRAGAPAVTRRQRDRLSELVAFARARSPFYRARYARLPAAKWRLADLPPVGKAELMARFDDWVTDPAVTRAGVAAFLADTRLIGRLHLDRFAVWTSSGSTGAPGIFVHDGDALTVYDALLATRGWPAASPPGPLRGFLEQGCRMAFVGAAGGHFVGVSSWERARRSYPWLADGIACFSALAPLSDLVAELNRFRPAEVVGYPSALVLLAREQRAGRLAIRPAFLLACGEGLDPATAAEIAAAFQCPVRDLYGASEFPHIAFGCERGWLHVNADWAILEPVDAERRPVPPGEESATALLTNLANRVQPLIRYDLGDSLRLRPESCPCGNPLPAIRVAGRRDDILYLRAPDGAAIAILPLAIATVAEDTPGVERVQIVQTGPARLRLRLAAAAGADDAAVWAALRRRLRAFLRGHGLPSIRLERAPEPPTPDPISGKFRQVWVAR